MKTQKNNSILNNIKQQQIQPKSVWYFRLREYALWLGITLALVVAGFAGGSLVFQTANYHLLPANIIWWFGFARGLILLIALMSAIFMILKTGRGYKRTWFHYFVLGFIVVGSLAAGLLSSRISGSIESWMGQIGVSRRAMVHWSMPEQTGLLAGELYEIDDNGYALVTDLENSIHIVDIAGLPTEDVEILLASLRVRMVGYEYQEIFYPCVIAPWRLRLAAPENHPDYGRIVDGNRLFADLPDSYDYFHDFYERKSEIVRMYNCHSEG